MCDKLMKKFNCEVFMYRLGNYPIAEDEQESGCAALIAVKRV